MIDIEKDVLYYITIEDEHEDKQEIVLTKEQLTELYGKCGEMLSADYQEEIKEFFKKSKETPGTEKAKTDAISTQEIPEPEKDLDTIWLHSN